MFEMEKRVGSAGHVDDHDDHDQDHDRDDHDHDHDRDRDHHHHDADDDDDDDNDDADVNDDDVDRCQSETQEARLCVRISPSHVIRAVECSPAAKRLSISRWFSWRWFYSEAVEDDQPTSYLESRRGR